MCNYTPMKPNKLRKFISEYRKITIAEAAEEVGITRQYLSEIINGRRAGRATAIKISKWADGFVSVAELMRI